MKWRIRSVHKNRVTLEHEDGTELDYILSGEELRQAKHYYDKHNIPASVYAKSATWSPGIHLPKWARLEDI